jgi:hypothetical protein
LPSALGPERAAARPRRLGKPPWTPKGPPRDRESFAKRPWRPEGPPRDDDRLLGKATGDRDAAKRPGPRTGRRAIATPRANRRGPRRPPRDQRVICQASLGPERAAT